MKKKILSLLILSLTFCYFTWNYVQVKAIQNLIALSIEANKFNSELVSILNILPYNRNSDQSMIFMAEVT